MDLATVFGLFLAFSAVAFGVAAGGAGLGIYLDLPSVCITFLGAFFATMTQFAGADIKKFPALFRKATVHQSLSPQKLIADLVRFAEIARRDGILALEGFADNIEDAFLKRGIRLAVDGTDPELIEEMMSAELAQQGSRHERSRKMFETLAANLPGFGLIGTLIGLVGMMANLSDPKVIGPSMAVALLTTLYGALGCYLVFQPLARKLEQRSKEEAAIKELIIQGVMSIQSGDNPRVVEQKLKTFLPPDQRQK